MNQPVESSNSILERITDAVIALDANWCFTFLNSRAEQLFNKPAGQLTGKQIWAAFPQYTEQPFYKACYQAMEEQQQACITLYYPEQDAWFENHIYPSANGLTIFFIEVTLKKKEADLLVQNEERFKVLIENNEGIISLIDENFQLIFRNHAATLITGRCNEEYEKIKGVDHVHPDNAEYIKAVLAESLKHPGKVIPVLLRVLHKTGNYIWLEGVITNKLNDPAIRGVLINLRDVTKRIVAEQKLKTEKDFSDKIINSLPGVFYMTDVTGKLIRWNKAFETISGYSAEELETIDTTKLYHPKDHESFRLSVGKAFTEGKGDTEVNLVSKDGKKMPYYFTGVKIDHLGKPALLGVGIDISEKEKAAAAIEKSNERFLLVTKATNDMIWDWDVTTGEIWRNSNYNKLFGYDESVSVHPISLWIESVHPEDRQRVEDGISKVMNARKANIHSSEEYWTDEYRLLKKDGTVIFIYDRGYILYDEQGRPLRMIGSMVNITERIKAEQEIKESNERFLLVTKATNDMIWDWNLHTDELWWNNNYNNLFGDDGALEARNISSWVNNIHPEDRQRVRDGIYKVIHSAGNYWSDEYRYLKKDGSVLFMYDRGYILYDGSGKPSRMIGSMLNITERITAAQALKDSEEKYRTLVEQASDAIYIIDSNGRIITINNSACRLFQYQEKELLQMSVYDFVSADELKENPIRFAELSLGNTVIVKRKAKRKDGVFIHIENTAKMLADGRILIFARDISESVKVQHEMIREKDFSNAIINSLPGIFYLHDDKGKFLRWNKNFETISGYSTEELGNMHPLDLFDADEKELLLQKAREVFEKEKADVEAFIFTKDENKIPYYISGWKVMFEGKTCLIAIGINIAEKRKAEELLKESYEDIRSLATHLTKIREEERKRIGREIHDELGQQLTAIKMDVAWIEKKIPDETGIIKDKLKNIITLLDGSNQSVRRILSELSPGVIDNHGLLEALERQNIQFTATTGIPVEFTTAETKIKLAQEIANCIFRVYQESLTNIMRYARAGKVVTSLKIINDAVVVIIKDDGQGFNSKAVQAKKSFGILGMKERVLSQNGKFELDSRAGKGTKITISIPYSV
jgi:PAS domain S-box-containing protein